MITISADLNATSLARDARREFYGMAALCLPSFILVFILLILPIGWLFWMSLFNVDGAFSAENYIRMFDSTYARTFLTTFQVGFLVTASCVVLGYPLSYMLSQLPPRMAGLCTIFVVLPFWTSTLVRTYAWMLLLQRKGIINSALISLGLIDDPIRMVNNVTGTVIGMVHIMLPFLVLPLYGVMKSISPDYVRAAANLGASPVRAFWTVFFPQSLPGLTAGMLLVFVLCLGFYVTPALLGGGRVIMWSMMIDSSIRLYANWGAASALGVALLVMTFCVLWLVNRLFGLKRLYGSAR
jgi:putative spermidine/putrescine transport system permease protein/spermidine/putrescine transport system permease protein